MVNLGLPPLDLEGSVGDFLTFILPAVDGCNLKCSFCVISQRREISYTQLEAADFVRFLHDISIRKTVVGVALQGYEPLLPDTLRYTVEILEEANRLAIPTSVVTNGIRLRAAMPALATLKPNKIGVSLDAADARRHDRLRGLDGAWLETVAGINDGLRQLPDARQRIVVVSTLMPERRSYLEGMPQMLAGLGVREWIINPLMTIGKNPWTQANKRQRLVDDLTLLSDAAACHDIDLTIDDELGLLTSSFTEAEIEGARRLSIRTLPAGVTLSRLVPSGQLAVGMDIARPQSPTAPRWQPGNEHPADFLAMMARGSAEMHCIA